MLKFRHQSRRMSCQENTTKVNDVRDRAQEILQDIGESFSMKMSKDDMKSPQFWKTVFAELIGCIVLVLFGCGSWIETDVEEHPLTVRIALTFGLVYAVVLYILRPVSGGHINPTVTIAMVVTKRISLARAGFYCIAQVTGGIIGAALLLSFTPTPYRDSLGCTVTAMELSAGQGFGIEVIISFFYVFVVFSCYAKVTKTESVVHSLFTPFIIGFAAVTTHLFAIPFTGASLNPARTFGPAVVTGNWKNHWIYWFGPIIGGTLGGVIQQTAFGKKASLKNLKTCMVVHEENNSTDKISVTSLASLPKSSRAQTFNTNKRQSPVSTVSSNDQSEFPKKDRMAQSANDRNSTVLFREDLKPIDEAIKVRHNKITPMPEKEISEFSYSNHAHNVDVNNVELHSYNPSISLNTTPSPLKQEQAIKEDQRQQSPASKQNCAHAGVQTEWERKENEDREDANSDFTNVTPLATNKEPIEDDAEHILSDSDEGDELDDELDDELEDELEMVGVPLSRKELSEQGLLQDHADNDNEDKKSMTLEKEKDNEGSEV